MNNNRKYITSLQKGITIFIFAAMVSTCTNFGGAKSEKKIVHRFTIDTKISSISPIDPNGPVISVQPIKMSAPFETQRIAYSLTAHKINYYSRNEWANLPSKMLQPLFIRSLETGGKFSAVIERGSRALSDYLLETEILKILHRFETPDSYADVAIRIQLVSLQSKQVIATTIFEKTQKCSSNDAYGAVLAFNKAFASIITDSVNFITGKIKTNRKSL